MDGLYSIYDRVAEEFSPPQVCKNDGTAFRMFKATMAKTPDYVENEYWCMRVGQWDSEKGIVIPEKRPVRIEGVSLDESV